MVVGLVYLALFFVERFVLGRGYGSLLFVVLLFLTGMNILSSIEDLFVVVCCLMLGGARPDSYARFVFHRNYGLLFLMNGLSWIEDLFVGLLGHERSVFDREYGCWFSVFGAVFC